MAVRRRQRGRPPSGKEPGDLWERTQRRSAAMKRIVEFPVAISCISGWIVPDSPRGSRRVRDRHRHRMSVLRSSPPEQGVPATLRRVAISFPPRIAVGSESLLLALSGGLLANALGRETGRRFSADGVTHLQSEHARASARQAVQVRPLPGARELVAYLSHASVPWAIADQWPSGGARRARSASACSRADTDRTSSSARARIASTTIRSTCYAPSTRSGPDIGVSG